MNISLTPTLEALVKSKLDSGLYNNASEVIREALRMMEENDRIKALKIELLKKEFSLALKALEKKEYSNLKILEIAEQVLDNYQSG